MSQSSSMPAPIDAATVIVARDGAQGPEILMLKKNSKIYFGGMWVFPGGRVDAGDRNDAEGDGMAAFRAAAIREAREEAGLDLADCELVHLSHWMPPPIRPKRFSTHFFFARAPQTIETILVDGEEITEHRWITATNALQRRDDGEIELATPTFVTLTGLSRFASVADALAAIDGPTSFHTHIVKVEGGSIAFYAGDVAYDSMDDQVPGPRRCAYMMAHRWWWEEHDGHDNGPWPTPVLNSSDASSRS